MAERPQLTAEPRTVRGKQVSRLRRQGIAPGVVYGPPVAAPQPVSVEAHTLEQIYHAHGPSALVDLTVGETTLPVFIRSVQREPIRHGVLSVEFYAPEMSQPVVSSVPVVLVGELAATVDGVLTFTRETVEVRGLPDRIPQHLEAHVAGLDDVDSAILVPDLAMPEGIEVLTPGEEIVVKVAAPTRPVEPEPEVEEALAEETGDLPAAAEDVPPVNEPGQSGQSGQ
jgi:large subunit ribosomal protein L25